MDLLNKKLINGPKFWIILFVNLTHSSINKRSHRSFNGNSSDLNSLIIFIQKAKKNDK